MKGAFSQRNKLSVKVFPNYDIAKCFTPIEVYGTLFIPSPVLIPLWCVRVCFFAYVSSPGVLCGALGCVSLRMSPVFPGILCKALPSVTTFL